MPAESNGGLLMHIDDLHVLQLENELQKIRNETQKLEFDKSKYLHEHTWKRLMWYRDELWRVTIPVWTAFGTLNAAVLAISIKNEASLKLYRAIYILLGLVGFGLIIMRVYSWYVKTISEAVSELNKSMKLHEDAIDSKHKSNYALHMSIPGLPELFYLIGCVLIFVAVGIIFNSINDPQIDSSKDLVVLIASIIHSIPFVHKVGILEFITFLLIMYLSLKSVAPKLSNRILVDHRSAKHKYKVVSLAYKEKIKEDILAQFKGIKAGVGHTLAHRYIDNYKTTLTPKELSVFDAAVDELIASKYVSKNYDGYVLTGKGFQYIY